MQPRALIKPKVSRRKNLTIAVGMHEAYLSSSYIRDRGPKLYTIWSILFASSLALEVRAVPCNFLVQSTYEGGN